jgi:outer membrane protein OmpA-like peptidoglycan-associated protein
MPETHIHDPRHPFETDGLQDAIAVQWALIGPIEAVQLWSLPMFAKLLAAAVIGVSLVGMQPAAADPSVKADDIVAFFVKTASLGAGRGLCIGTAQECDKTAPKPAGFDMLINFDLDSANLTGQARQNLDEFAKALHNDQLASARFVVEGYTDARGTETYNLGLSERRAEAVTTFLFERGVARDKVSAVGKGMANPRVPDPMDPVNRRVEMKIELQ